ncbi:hypothetical protein ACFPC0_22715, partial [Streptomyces andamanensis]
ELARRNNYAINIFEPQRLCLYGVLSCVATDLRRVRYLIVLWPAARGEHPKYVRICATAVLVMHGGGVLAEFVDKGRDITEYVNSGAKHTMRAHAGIALLSSRLPSIWRLYRAPSVPYLAIMNSRVHLLLCLAKKIMRANLPLLSILVHFMLGAAIHNTAKRFLGRYLGAISTCGEAALQTLVEERMLSIVCSSVDAQSRGCASAHALSFAGCIQAQAKDQLDRIAHIL